MPSVPLVCELNCGGNWDGAAGILEQKWIYIYMYINGLDLLLRIEILGAGCDVEDVELIYLWGS